MDIFVALPGAQRRALCEQAGQLLGLDAASVEKDFWVCWTLRELFALPEYGPHLTFKGGTSLSKGWKLIERFSEDIDPSTTPEIQPYLAEALPGQLSGSTFSVRTLAPERTFWEKASLLHEEGFRTGGGGPAARLARHYYDLWCLIKAGVADRAFADIGLFERVVTHRNIFFRKNKEAKESLRPGSLRLLPSDERRPAWKQDYDAMRETMFFGDAPAFDEILRVVGEFERRFNTAAAPSS